MKVFIICLFACILADMKKIEAVLKTWEVGYVRDALVDLGIVDLLVTDVRDYIENGSGPDEYRGEAYSKYEPRAKVEIVVNDEKVNSVIKTIEEVALTKRGNQIGTVDKIHDGRIMVSPVDSIRLIAKCNLPQDKEACILYGLECRWDDSRGCYEREVELETRDFYSSAGENSEIAIAESIEEAVGHYTPWYSDSSCATGGRDRCIIDYCISKGLAWNGKFERKGWHTYRGTCVSPKKVSTTKCVHNDAVPSKETQWRRECVLRGDMIPGTGALYSIKDCGDWNFAAYCKPGKTGFFEQEEGTKCEESNLIDNMSTCKSAAWKHGIYYKSEWSGSDYKITSGCSYSHSEQKLYYNQDKLNLGSRSDLMAICKSHTKQAMEASVGATESTFGDNTVFYGTALFLSAVAFFGGKYLAKKK